MAIATSTILLSSVIALGVASAGMATWGSIAQYQAQQEMAEYNQAVAEQQAQIAQANADLTIQQSENEAIAKEQDSRRQAQLEKDRQLRIKSMNRANPAPRGLP